MVDPKIITAAFLKQADLEPEITEDWISEAIKKMPGKNTNFSRKTAAPKKKSTAADEPKMECEEGEVKLYDKCRKAEQGVFFGTVSAQKVVVDFKKSSK